MDIGEFLRMIRRHWIMVGATTLLGVLVAAVLYAVLPANYSAEASLFVSVKSNAAPLIDRSQFALQRVGSYPQLAWSPTVLDPVIEGLALDESVEKLRKSVTVSNPTGTVFIQVEAEDADPEQAAAIANAVSDSLAAAVESLEAESGDAGDRVGLIVASRAMAPTAASSPPLVVILLLGLLIGLAIGVFVALLSYRAHQRVPGLGEIEETSGVSVLGRVPRPGAIGRRRRHAVSAHRGVRLALLAANGGELPGVIVIVPIPDDRAQRRAIDGLAESLMDGGRRVAVVQTRPVAPRARVESPDAEAKGGRRRRFGLAQVLGGSTPLADAVTISKRGIFLVPAGWPTVPITRKQLGARVQVVVRQLRRLADVGVVIATEQTVPLDVALAAPAADLVVLLIDARALRADELSNTASELAARGVSAAGAILVGGDR